jgi:hypothetical protein
LTKQSSRPNRLMAWLFLAFTSASTATWVRMKLRVAAPSFQYAALIAAPSGSDTDVDSRRIVRLSAGRCHWSRPSQRKRRAVVQGESATPKDQRSKKRGRPKAIALKAYNRRVEMALRETFMAPPGASRRWGCVWTAISLAAAPAARRSHAPEEHLRPLTVEWLDTDRAEPPGAEPRRADASERPEKSPVAE